MAKRCGHGRPPKASCCATPKVTGVVTTPRPPRVPPRSARISAVVVRRVSPVRGPFAARPLYGATLLRRFGPANSRRTSQRFLRPALSHSRVERRRQDAAAFAVAAPLCCCHRLLPFSFAAHCALRMIRQTTAAPSFSMPKTSKAKAGKARSLSIPKPMSDESIRDYCMRVWQFMGSPEEGRKEAHLLLCACNMWHACQLGRS